MCLFRIINMIMIAVEFKSYWDLFCNFLQLLERLDLLVSDALLMPISSSGESWLRPMRSNLQHAKREEQYSTANTGAVCWLRTKAVCVDQKTSCRFHLANSPCRHLGALVERDRNWWSVEGDEDVTHALKMNWECDIHTHTQMSAFHATKMASTGYIRQKTP